MLAEDLLIEVRDRDLKRVGQLPGTATWQLTDAHLGVGAWEIGIPIEHPMCTALEQPGSGIIATGADGPVYSGPMTQLNYEATAADPLGLVKVSGVSDAIVLADNLAFPDPETADPLAQRVSVDVRSGPADYLMHALVNANLGPGAPDERRIPHLILGEDHGLGGEMSVRCRFETLLEILAKLGAASGVAFTVVQHGDALIFKTYMPSDLSKERRWSLTDNRLSGSRIAVAAPTLTRPIVGGEEDEVDRVFAAPTSEAAATAEAVWGRRIERFIDGSAEDAEQTGFTALDEEGTTKVSAQPVPVDDDAAGLGYQLGSTVAVDAFGIEAQTTVTGYTMKADADGYKTEAALGDASAVDFGRWLGRQSSKADRRLTRLERGRAKTVQRTDTQTVTLAPGETVLQVAALPADAATTAFGETTVTITLDQTSTTKLRLVAGSDITLEDQELQAQARGGPFSACLAQTEEGTGLYLSVRSESETDQETAVTVTVQYAAAGGGESSAAWVPEAEVTGPPVVTFAQAGIRSTRGDLETPTGGDGTASVNGGYRFRPGPTVTCEGTINRPILEDEAPDAVVQSVCGTVGYGARPGTDLIWDLSDTAMRVLMLDAEGTVTLTAPAGTAVGIALDGITYTPRH